MSAVYQIKEKVLAFLKKEGGHATVAKTIAYVETSFPVVDVQWDQAIYELSHPEIHAYIGSAGKTLFLELRPASPSEHSHLTPKEGEIEHR